MLPTCSNAHDDMLSLREPVHCINLGVTEHCRQLRVFSSEVLPGQPNGCPRVHTCVLERLHCSNLYPSYVRLRASHEGFDSNCELFQGGAIHTMRGDQSYRTSYRWSQLSSTFSTTLLSRAPSLPPCLSSVSSLEGKATTSVASNSLCLISLGFSVTWSRERAAGEYLLEKVTHPIKCLLNIVSRFLCMFFQEMIYTLPINLLTVFDWPVLVAMGSPPSSRLVLQDILRILYLFTWVSRTWFSSRLVTQMK